MVEYTEISDSQRELYYGKFLHKHEFKNSMARGDPSMFAYYMLGFKPYDYQDLFLNDDSRFKVVCVGRQAGKTTMTSILALHRALWNRGFRVVVFSRNENQSKKLLSMIREFMQMGDVHMAPLIRSKRGNFFSEQVDPSRPNNTQQISFRNGASIISLPATDGARGYTADLVILDEAAFMEDEIFESVIEPMVTHSGGSLVLLSTPNGQRGFFHKIFDPLKTGRHDEYSKYWYPSVICPEPLVKEFVELKQSSTDSLTFNQEYLALFTSNKNAYFPVGLVEKALSEDLEFVGNSGSSCYMGVDWGKKNDQSVIAITEEGPDYVKLLYLHAFPLNTNYKDVIDAIGTLKKKFNVAKIIADAGSGEAQICEMEDRGWHVEGFGFSIQSKLTIFSTLRRLLEKEKLKFPPDKKLIDEFKSFEYTITTHGNMKLHHPAGGHDDRLDALALACKEYNRQEVVRIRLV